MKKISLLPILLFLFSFPVSAQELESASPEEVGVSSDRINRLTNVMQEYVDQNKMSGAVALVARKNKIIYYKITDMHADYDSVISFLKEKIKAPCLGEVPYFKDFDPYKASKFIDINKLNDKAYED